MRWMSRGRVPTIARRVAPPPPPPPPPPPRPQASKPLRLTERGETSLKRWGSFAAPPLQESPPPSPGQHPEPSFEPFRGREHGAGGDEPNVAGGLRGLHVSRGPAAMTSGGQASSHL